MPPAVADGTHNSPKRPGARQIAAAVTLAITGFLLTAAVLHAAIVTAIRDPLRLYAAIRSEKLALLPQWHGRIFSAAFGSSHVHNGFDPRAFDEAMAASPEPTTTANLAVEGGAQPEQMALAQTFVRQLVPPHTVGAADQPCLVLLELGEGANFTPDHLVHPRAINLYSWPRVRLVSELTDARMRLTQRLGRIGFALTAMGLHYASVGMLSNAIFQPPLDMSMLHRETTGDRRGEDELSPDAKTLADMRRMVANPPARPEISPGEVLPGNSALVQRIAEAGAGKHLSFVYVLMPKLGDLFQALDYPDHLTVALPTGATEVPILNLARPDRFPEVYRNLDLWHDDAHLDGDGARLVSRLLAQQLAAWYAQHGRPEPCG